MTTLLVDIGNTRVKWAVLRGARLGRMKAELHADSPTVLRSLAKLAPRDVRRVLVVSVADARLVRALDAAVHARFGIRCEQIHSTRAAHGVRNGYRDTWRLGADRWVGAIGAHALARGRAVVVANAGTALTIDVVDARGRHLGGAIAPGPSTMVESLLAGTHGIRRRAGRATPRVRGLLATDTAGALAAGAEFAATAFVDRAYAEAARKLKSRPVLFLTGGAARVIATRLATPAQEVPDLVLRGLAVFAQGD